MISFTLLALALPFVASQTVHQVTVGNAAGDLKFDPEAISAVPGDQVLFTFHQKNHTVVRSSFADPCAPVQENGFNAGFNFAVSPEQTDNFPTYTITINDTQPVWVYCAQPLPTLHCHKGMVFAVNCGQDGAPNSFTNFKAAAIAQGAANASSSASVAPPSPTDAPPSTISIPPAPVVSTVTATVTVEASTWTTTYASYPNSPAPTPASLEGNVIKVIVGQNGTLTYSPSFVKALPRDTLQFEFQTKNHTVTQSTFPDPCKKLNNATTGQVGFDSGFMPVAAGSMDFPTYNITINDTQPVWVYCRQTTPSPHCGAGMVLAINSDESSQRSSAAFASLAKQINGTANAASPSGSASSPSPSPSNGAVRTTAFGAVGLVTLVGGLMAML